MFLIIYLMKSSSKKKLTKIYFFQFRSKTKYFLYVLQHPFHSNVLSFAHIHILKYSSMAVTTTWHSVTYQLQLNLHTGVCSSPVCPYRHDGFSRYIFLTICRKEIKDATINRTASQSLSTPSLRLFAAF